MRELHPDVRVNMAMGREMQHRIAEFLERSNSIVARRPSPSGLAIPEVDAFGRLTDLYLAPGACDRFSSEELVAEIMTAVRESTADAQLQYHIAMNDNHHWVPITEKARQWREEMDSPEPPTSGNPEK
ncbi:hypothetical protein NONO_c10890 [Nocardia nova SH22a]|uniref:Uncharacterized protein n=1 Tax=Nocardia nova SH22a TaxID=1415166 RepID=W5TF89_9NOCA|nr:hypothetical protein [Nocardia nova]AHH15896.1 hypothetical protein NONO_c10890 [Nocardia nova SH22a]